MRYACLPLWKSGVGAKTGAASPPSAPGQGRATQYCDPSLAWHIAICRLCNACRLVRQRAQFPALSLFIPLGAFDQTCYDIRHAGLACACDRASAVEKSASRIDTTRSIGVCSSCLCILSCILSKTRDGFGQLMDDMADQI